MRGKMMKKKGGGFLPNRHMLSVYFRVCYNIIYIHIYIYIYIYMRGKMMNQGNQVKQVKQVRMMRVHTDKTQKCMMHTSA